MTIRMPQTILEERLRWVLPIVNKDIKLIDAAKVCPHGTRTLERWVAAYRQSGAAGLEPKSTRPKTNPKETPIRIKEQIIELRKQDQDSALTLKYQAAKLGIRIHERTIGKFIKAEGLTRKYRIRKVATKYVKALLKPGDLVEIDIKYVPGRLEDKRYYQFTAIDCASRWRYLAIYEDIGNGSAIAFLTEVMERAPFVIRAIKTDNGSCFTNRYTGYQKSADPLHPRLHPLDLFCQDRGIEHYLIDPGKPAQNGTVERSHRTDQEHFYDRVRFRSLEELKLKLRLWNMHYNDREHIGLGGKTPNEVLQLSHH
jgi:transposase InsO family protein